MEDCYEDGIDEWRHSGSSDCGGSVDLADDFDRQELEWALYSEIHHEEADDSQTHSQSWLEQEGHCDINITEEGETSGHVTASTPKAAQNTTDNSLLHSGQTSKKKKRKNLDGDNVKTSKDVKKNRKEKKSSSKDKVISLEALLVPEPSKVTHVNKTRDTTEGAHLIQHSKKQKHGDRSDKSPGVHKKGGVTQQLIVVSSDNSGDSDSDGECHHQNTAIDNGHREGSESDSDYSFGDMHVEEKMDIQLNIDDPENDNALDNNDMTVDDIHKSLGECDWDLIDADVWRTGTGTGPGTGRIKSRYYRTNVRCNNCNERGHLMKDCPHPKKLPACILCGLRGHMSRTCPESLCFNCHRPGHGSRNCTEPRRSRNVECRRCFTRGHIATECPDIWRQFHITTEPGPMCQGSQKENKNRYCCNCARRGHWAYECRESMMDSWKLAVTPFVAHYEVKAAFVTTRNCKKRTSDSTHETPAKHMKPSHTPTKKTPDATSKPSRQPTPYAKDILAKNKSTPKSRVKHLAESLDSDDFPRTPLEEYMGEGGDLGEGWEGGDSHRKKLTTKQENKRKWKAWQKKRKMEDRERKLSQLQQVTGHHDQHEAPSGGRQWRGDSERRHSGGGHRSRQDTGAGETSHTGGGRKRSGSRRGGRGGGGGGGRERRRSDNDRHTQGSSNDVWDPVDYRDPWDSHCDRHNSPGSHRDPGRKHTHVTQRVTQRGFRMSQQ